MSKLPEPMVPADCDLRDVPVPKDMLVRMAMANFGMSRRKARQLVDEVLAEHPEWT